MKKALSVFVLIFVLLLALISCSPNQSGKETSTTAVKQTTAETESSAPTNDKEESKEPQQGGLTNGGADTDTSFGEITPVG